MRNQQEQIEELLSNEGWRVLGRHAGGEWWLDELWIIESQWTPLGLRAYVSFLVDPQAPSERKPGEHVWAVAVSTQQAVRSVGIGEVPLRPDWEAKHKAEVHVHIRQLRAGIPSVTDADPRAGEQGTGVGALPDK